MERMRRMLFRNTFLSSSGSLYLSLYESSFMSRMGPSRGGTFESAFIADSQYSFEPMRKGPISCAFHQRSISMGSTWFSGQVFTTRTSLSSV